jgi:hypothetical protein
VDDILTKFLKIEVPKIENGGGWGRLLWELKTSNLWRDKGKKEKEVFIYNNLQ